jgi:hypothetical protein
LVSYFYHLSIIFYGFPKSGRKRESININELKLAQVGPRQAETRPRARPWCLLCTEVPRDLKKSHTLFTCVIDIYTETLPFLFLYNVGSTTRTATSRAPVSLYRPDNSTTGAPVRLTPNSTPNDHYPSTNFKVLAPNLSAHGDSAINGQTEAFSVIQSVLAQLAGSRSIKGIQEW